MIVSPSHVSWKTFTFRPRIVPKFMIFVRRHFKELKCVFKNLKIRNRKKGRVAFSSSVSIWPLVFFSDGVSVHEVDCGRARWRHRASLKSFLWASLRVFRRFSSTGAFYSCSRLVFPVSCLAWIMVWSSSEGNIGGARKFVLACGALLTQL